MCVLLIVNLDNIQARNKKTSKDYAEAICNIPMLVINEYLDRAKQAVEKMKSPFIDSNSRGMLSDIIGQSIQHIELRLMGVHRMIDKILERYMPKRDTIDLRGTFNDVMDLFQNYKPDIEDINPEEPEITQQSPTFNFTCDKRIPPMVITYG